MVRWDTADYCWVLHPELKIDFERRRNAGNKQGGRTPPGNSCSNTACPSTAVATNTPDFSVQASLDELRRQVHHLASPSTYVPSGYVSGFSPSAPSTAPSGMPLTWIFDFGCSCHITYDPSSLIDMHHNSTFPEIITTSGELVEIPKQDTITSTTYEAQIHIRVLDTIPHGFEDMAKSYKFRIQNFSDTLIK